MILGIDTATSWTALAVHDGTTVLAEMGWHSRQTQTIELAPAIQRLWTQAGITAADLEAVAVTIGPGSYTGLRIGMAAAKGIALGHKLPLIGVGTLDVVAAGLGYLEGNLVVVAEAGRNRLWSGRYEWQARKGWQPVAEPDLLDWDTLLAAVDPPMVVAGEVSAEASRQIRRTAGVRVVSPAASVRRGAVLAEIGYQRWKSHDVTDAAALAPVYLREPA